MDNKEIEGMLLPTCTIIQVISQLYVDDTSLTIDGK